MSDERDTPMIATARLATNRMLWGPLLIFAGLATLSIGGSHAAEASGLVATDYTRLFLGVLLTASGVVLMFMQIRRNSVYIDTEIIADGASGVPDSSGADYVIRQLAKNHQILRSQTSQGFMLSGVFMCLGLLAILAGYFGQLFGATTQGVNLTTIAGIMSEFISGTSLLLYRLNFKRLNQTSDRLDEAWRILAAHRLAEQLPEEKKAEATLKLIEALARGAK